MCHDAHMKSDDSGSPTTVSKQRKTTSEQALDAPSTDMSALVYVSQAAVMDNCKQEGMVPEVVNSDMDFVGFDDDPSAFLDIWKTINGSEFTSEFQKCLNESEKDDSNLNFNVSELTCLSVSDVNDAVTEKLTAPQHNTGEKVPYLQTAALLPVQSIQSLRGETKFVDAAPSTQPVPVGIYPMQLWHQNVQVHEPVMHHLQLLPTPLPTYQPDNCPELLKHHQVIQLKQHTNLRQQLQSHDAHSLSRTQHLQQQQQLQRNQVQSWYPTHTSAQHLQQYEMKPEQQTWSQQEWQTSAHCMQQAQQHLFTCQSVGVCTCAVKKEMPLSVIVSSAADATRAPQQMLPSLSETSGRELLPLACAAAYANAAHTNPSIYANCQPKVLDYNQSQHPSPGFLMNQQGGSVNFSQVFIPEFHSPSNFMPFGVTGQLFGHASAANQTRVVSRGTDSACPAVSGDLSVSDHFSAH